MNRFESVLKELDRAAKKYPVWPTDPLHALAILGEEFGELTKDALQLVYEPHRTSFTNLRDEAIQTAAMALQFLLSLDNYEFEPGRQHAKMPVDGETPLKVQCPMCDSEIPLLDRYVEDTTGSKIDELQQPCNTCEHNVTNETEMPCAFCVHI